MAAQFPLVMLFDLLSTAAAFSGSGNARLEGFQLFRLTGGEWSAVSN